MPHCQYSERERHEALNTNNINAIREVKKLHKIMKYKLYSKHSTIELSLGHARPCYNCLTHMSAWGPQYSFPSNSSGAAQGGLPHHVLRCSLGLNVLLKPKSTEEGIRGREREGRGVGRDEGGLRKERDEGDICIQRSVYLYTCQFDIIVLIQ